MIPRFLRNLFAERSGERGTPGDVVRAEAARFEARLSESTDAVDRHVESLACEEHTEEFLSGLASWIGERIRARHGGVWAEDPDHGLVLSHIDGVPHIRAFPLALAQHKSARGVEFPIKTFLDNIDKGLERERAFDEYHKAAPLTRGEIAAALLEDGPEAAGNAAESFREFWQNRFGKPLPLSLQGVRGMDGFLRSQYLFTTIRGETIVRAGFVVGEVARSLFGGEWNFDKTRLTGNPADCALSWPELDLYPVGKILKTMTERPDGDPLDEYVRLVPAARRELRTQANTEEKRDA